MTRDEWARRKNRSSTNWISKSTRFAIYYRDKFDCVYCKAVFPPAMDGVGLTLDHIVPRSLGGSNHRSNLVTACETCNSARQHKELPAKELSRLRRKARKKLNVEVGRFLAAVANSSRELGSEHPLTRRLVQRRQPRCEYQLRLGF